MACIWFSHISTYTCTCILCIFKYLFVSPTVYTKKGEYPTSSTTLRKVENGEKYVLDHTVMHKATSMLIMWIVEYRKNGRDMFYTNYTNIVIFMISTPSNVVAQNEIQVFLETARFLRNFLERGPKSQSIENFWQWKITFLNSRAVRISNTTW